KGLVAGEGAVEEVRHTFFIAEAADRIHLVLHERDERAYHDRGAFAHERGQLVTEAFASTGGHDHECVPAFQYVLYDRLLFSFELAEPEELLESFPGGESYLDHL